MPAYCSAGGRVFRLLRSSQLVAPDRLRFVLRAQPINSDESAAVELAREVDTDLIRDKIQHRQAIPTPEATYEALWQQLRVDLNR